LLKGGFRVSNEGGVISKKHLPDKDLAQLGLRSEVGKVLNVPVALCLEEDAIIGLAECVVQEQREEYAGKCRGQDTPMFHSALDWEGVR
jgi:hypothetical protein